MKILIMAGGKGTRLWPLSRNQRPKQFQKLTSDKTMLQETVARAMLFAGWDDVYISTAAHYIDEVKRELPKIPQKNIIGEPVNRERAASIALSCAFFAKRCPKETVVLLPADHLIKKNQAFISAIRRADMILSKHPDYLITIGIKPKSVDTGLGYIKAGRIMSKDKKSPAYKIEKFIEKPDFRTAQGFIKSGEYFWNAGIFVFKISNLLGKYKKFAPDTYTRALKLTKVVDTPNYQKVLEKEYPKSDPVSFEYSIVENDDKALVIPANLGWSDVGSWSVLKDSLGGKGKENFVKAAHLDIGSKDLLVYGSHRKLIATVGLKGLVIVDTNDVILICDKSRSQEVKEIVKMLEKTNGERHL